MRIRLVPHPDYECLVAKTGAGICLSSGPVTRRITAVGIPEYIQFYLKVWPALIQLRGDLIRSNDGFFAKLDQNFSKSFDTNKWGILQCGAHCIIIMVCLKLWPEIALITG